MNPDNPNLGQDAEQEHIDAEIADRQPTATQVLVISQAAYDALADAAMFGRGGLVVENSDDGVNTRAARQDEIPVDYLDGPAISAAREAMNRQTIEEPLSVRYPWTVFNEEAPQDISREMREIREARERSAREYMERDRLRDAYRITDEEIYGRASVAPGTIIPITARPRPAFGGTRMTVPLGGLPGIDTAAEHRRLYEEHLANPNSNVDPSPVVTAPTPDLSDDGMGPITMALNEAETGFGPHPRFPNHLFEPSANNRLDVWMNEYTVEEPTYDDDGDENGTTTRNICGSDHHLTRDIAIENRERDIGRFAQNPVWLGSYRYVRAKRQETRETLS